MIYLNSHNQEVKPRCQISELYLNHNIQFYHIQLLIEHVPLYVYMYMSEVFQRNKNSACVSVYMGQKGTFFFFFETQYFTEPEPSDSSEPQRSSCPPPQQYHYT